MVIILENPLLLPFKYELIRVISSDISFDMFYVLVTKIFKIKRCKSRYIYIFELEWGAKDFEPEQLLIVNFFL